MPKQVKNHGLKAKEFSLTDEALTDIDPLLHPRGGRAEPRARDRQARAQGG
jgi:hypothetical protein